MFLDEYVELRNCLNIREYYKNLGYEVTGKYIKVRIEDLSKNSNKKVRIKCDYCGIEFERTFSNHMRYYSFGHDSCNKCYSKKIKDTCQERYGYDNVFYVPEFIERQKETCLERYGVPNALMNEEIKNKVKNTCIKLYGTENSLSNAEIREKAKQTMLKKYGVENCMKNKTIAKKMRDSMFKNGTCPSSAGQRYVCDKLNGILNYPVENYNLDILLEDRIYIEYDGSGHDLSVINSRESVEQFNKRAKDRYLFLNKLGYKMIRILDYKDKVVKYKIESIVNKYLYLLQTNEWIIIDLDRLKIITNNSENELELYNE